MNKRVAISAIRRAAASRKAGYLDAVLQASKNTSATHVELTPQDFLDLRERFSTEPIGGPGTELSALLKRFGIEPTPTCACRSKAAQMDALGPDECSKPERIEEVVGVMREEAKARGLPFVDAAGRLLVKRAISNARRKEAAARAEGSPHHNRREAMAPPLHDAQG